jgi:ribosome biogenesis protein Nip4
MPRKDFLVVDKKGRKFFLKANLFEIARKDFFHAGIYLGKVKNRKFFPSFSLLKMLAEGEANKVIVRTKTAWLFICGRDVFGKGILKVIGSRNKGDHTLVLNEFGECLGFGKIIRRLDKETKKTKVVIENVADVGDFLRREA